MTLPATSTPLEPLRTVRVGACELGVPAERLWAFPGGRYYEYNVEHWLDRMLAATPDPVLYDVGANIGYYPVRYAAKVRHVYAFEPVSTTFAVLERNLRANGLENATALRVGLSDADGEAEINLWSSSGSNTLYARDVSHESLGTETIALAGLDGLVAREQMLPPTVMKIDVEGAELPALRGGRELIAAHRPFLIVECVASTCEDAGYAQEELFAELRRHGYALIGLSENGSDNRLHPLDAPNVPIANAIAVPAGSPVLLNALTGSEARSFVTVAYLDEVLDRPELLAAYGGAFGEDDDATLVIHAGDDGAAAALGRLAAIVEELGLDGPDMLALAHPAAVIDAPLSHAATAVLSERPARDGYDARPHFAAGDVPALTALHGRRAA